MSALTGPPHTVAAFDFDGTLSQRDTLLPFLARGLGWPRFALLLLRCLPHLAGHALGLVRNDIAKARLLEAALAGRSLADIQTWTDRWIAGGLTGRLRPWTQGRLAWHQQAGHCCVLVSASPDIYLRRVAADLGFDGLVCTEMQVQSDRLTGQMQTPNCHGEQKVLRLQAWLDSRFGSAGTADVVLYAYGDTAGDKPMLRMAKYAWLRGKLWSDAKAKGKAA